MYQKGENEFFFTTHFTENVINCSKNNEINECRRTYHKDYFTVGTEGMLLGFDHFYTTSFEEQAICLQLLKKELILMLKMNKVIN